MSDEFFNSDKFHQFRSVLIAQSSAPLSNYPIRSGQNVWRDCYMDLFCRLQIHRKLKFHWLLYGQVGRLDTFR